MRNINRTNENAFDFVKYFQLSAHSGVRPMREALQCRIFLYLLSALCFFHWRHSFTARRSLTSLNNSLRLQTQVYRPTICSPPPLSKNARFIARISQPIFLLAQHAIHSLACRAYATSMTSVGLSVRVSPTLVPLGGLWAHILLQKVTHGMIGRIGVLATCNPKPTGIIIVSCDLDQIQFHGYGKMRGFALRRQ